MLGILDIGHSLASPREGQSGTKTEDILLLLTIVLDGFLFLNYIYCPSRNQAGVCATGEIRQQVKFAAFWCVFLTKIKVDTESW